LLGGRRVGVTGRDGVGGEPSAGARWHHRLMLAIYAHK
jgi:hypothetical protein